MLTIVLISTINRSDVKHKKLGKFIMNNIEIIKEIGFALNQEALELLENNDTLAVASWNDDIQEAKEQESSLEISSHCSKTGNPILVKL